MNPNTKAYDLHIYNGKWTDAETARGVGDLRANLAAGVTNHNALIKSAHAAVATRSDFGVKTKAVEMLTGVAVDLQGQVTAKDNQLAAQNNQLTAKTNELAEQGEVIETMTAEKAGMAVDIHELNGRVNDLTTELKETKVKLANSEELCDDLAMQLQGNSKQLQENSMLIAKVAAMKNEKSDGKRAQNDENTGAPAKRHRSAVGSPSAHENIMSLPMSKIPPRSE